MASEPERPPADDDTVVIRPSEHAAADETTQADEQWPVSDFYRVEPEGATSPAGDADSAQIVATTTAAAPPAARRFPPDVGPGLLLVILGVVAAVIVAAALLALDDDPQASAQAPGGAQTTTTPVETTTPPPTAGAVAVAVVEGMSLAEARAALEKQGFRVRVSRSPSDRPEGEVLSQSPPAGAEVAKGTVVALVASSGTRPAQEKVQIEVPNLVGQSASSASAAIRELGLTPRIRLVTSSERPGTVVDQTPSPGTEATDGATITLEVAKARPEVRRIEVPDVIGSTAAAARSELRSAGFRVSTVAVVSQEPAGTVIEQSPRAGAELEKGDTVRLTVSTGPAKVDVPDVTGLDEQSARLELERAGFQVQMIDESTTDPAQDGVVFRQSPEGGASARDGATVTITVGRLG